VRLFTVNRQPMYDADSKAYITQLTECLSKLTNCKSFCFVGDLNCPGISHATLASRRRATQLYSQI